MLNNVALVGRMTKDAELRRTASGKAVASFTLAVNRGYQDAGGKEADFIPVVTWNKLAESIAQYCSKGSLVSVEGSLRDRTYQNHEGKNVYVIEVLADRVDFLDTRKKEEKCITDQASDSFVSIDDIHEIDF